MADTSSDLSVGGSPSIQRSDNSTVGANAKFTADGIGGNTMGGGSPPIYHVFRRNQKKIRTDSTSDLDDLTIY